MRHGSAPVRERVELGGARAGEPGRGPPPGDRRVRSDPELQLRLRVPGSEPSSATPGRQTTLRHALAGPAAAACVRRGDIARHA